MKKLDYLLNTILVFLAIVLCIYSWIWASKITQHKFEPLESDVLIPYQFTQEDDGMVIQSEYGLAWKHSTFSDSRIVAYDSIYGNSVYLKKEYEEVGGFFGEWAPVKKNGKWGFIDKQGKIIVDLIYDDLYSYGEKSATVYKYGNKIEVERP